MDNSKNCLQPLAFRYFLQLYGLVYCLLLKRCWSKYLKAPLGAACAVPCGVAYMDVGKGREQGCGKLFFACQGQPAFTCAKGLAVIPHRLRIGHNQFLEVSL